mgnify:CR=1 FL=1
MDRPNVQSRVAFIMGVILLGLLTLLSGCSPGSETAVGEAVVAPCEALTPYPRETLPEGIEWRRNDRDPIFASPQAVKGGTFHEALLSFPLTFRVVGPDSNSSMPISTPRYATRWARSSSASVR